ncbi:cupin domain-containing protein [Pandoraea nosoerga]|uniref:Cupin domain-containing protein n=1 Tax=Pandoraea nosoerga TaxID=2508296 RepID=A0A5E4T0Z1_9BURK|nr:cupin domain-containing protein [Pandoraea nosoerga]VVD81111.1 cupin domain-containing protein [Pandoraea nosoerga]
MLPLPKSPRSSPSSSTLAAHRFAGTLAALGVAALGLALTPPAQRALPGWLDALCSVATSANQALVQRFTEPLPAPSAKSSSPSPLSASPAPSRAADARLAAMASTSGGDGAAARPATVLKPLSCEPLANAPGKSVTTAIVEFAPLAYAPAHRHPGAVTAVVIEGTIRSQLNAEPVHTYTANQTWFEPPGTLHTLTENPDPTRRARLLAFFVTEENCGPLTIYEPSARPS